ncbi:MAG: cell division protein FtsZ [Candidatus Limnocylindria bacterium]
MDPFASDLLKVLLTVAVVALIAGVAMVAGNRKRGGRTIRVVGIGGGGANAVEAMIRAGMRGVEYVVVNTDTRALRRSSARKKIAIGKGTTDGLGAGGDAALGETAARDAAEAIAQALAGSDLVVITAGLGGGTGSGAAPVVADIARQQGALAMAVVTKPFQFEGARRQQVAQAAADILVARADAVATVPNDRVREIMSADVTVEDAFRAIDDVMRRSLGEIVDLIAVPGRINLDFADVRAALQGGGAAVVGLGRAGGENRATEATRAAMAATLLEAQMEGARSILLNVSGSRKLKLAEVDEVAHTVRATAGQDANIVFGMSLDSRLRDEVQVTLIATGFDSPRSAPEEPHPSAPEPAYPKRGTMAATVPTTQPGTMAATVPTTQAGTMAATQAGTESAEWRPVWLRRAGTDPVPGPAPGPRPKRAKRAPAQRPHSAEGTPDPG